MNEETNKPSLFQDNSEALALQRDAAGVARATQEIQAALVIGKRFERDEIRAKAKIIQACQRKGLAEAAEYEYSRGGTRITGPTIDLLRAIANRWGNILFGWAEVERRDGESSIRCWAWDTQFNSRAERTFIAKHWRDTQSGGYRLEDERDIYEMLANLAARRVRACLEEVIDSDIVNDAIDQCRKTLKEGEKIPLQDRAASMVTAFLEFGVTRGMIETRLGNNLESVSENQLASLRRVYRSLKDGVGKREDYFKPETAKPDLSTPKASDDEAAEAAAGLAPAPKPTAPVTKAEPEPEKPKAKAKPESAFNPVKSVRGLCKMSDIPEGKLIEALAALGSTDGSPSSIEEVELQFPGVLKMVCDNWTDMARKLKGQ